VASATLPSPRSRHRRRSGTICFIPAPRSPALLPALPRNAWIVLGGDLLSAIGSGLTLPFLVVYLHRVRELDLELAGAALSTIALAALFGNPIAGLLVDRFGSRGTLVFGLLTTAAGTAAIAFVTEPWHAFAATAATGFGRSVIWPAQDSLLAVTVRPEQRSSVFAVRHATLNTGFGIGGLVAASIVDFDSTRSFQVLYLLDAATFLLFVPLLLALKGVGAPAAPDPNQAAEAPRYRTVLRDAAFRHVLVLTVLLCLVGYGSFNAAFPAFATEPGGISAAALGVAFAVNTLAVSVLALPVLRLAHGRRRTVGVVLVFALWATTWMVTLLAGELDGFTAVALFAGAAAIFALGETLLSPAVPPLVNDLATDRLRGRYNALYTLAWTVGFILAPLIAGVALGAGQATALFLGLIAACGVGAFAAVRLRRTIPAELDLVGGPGRE
jgi:MFS family permease